MSYFKNRLISFTHAFRGLSGAFKKEIHFQLFVILAVFVVILGFYFQLTRIEWILILTAIALVICLELINSAVEKLCDVVKPEKDEIIKYIKDVLAASVLLACFYAVIVGILIFLPYFKSNLN